MQSTTRLMLAASLMLAVPGCVGSPVIVASPSACAKLIPPNWKQGVGHAADPAPAPPKPADPPGVLAWTLEELKKWTGYAVAEAERVDQADGRTGDAIGIFERCETRDASAVQKARPKILGIIPR